jgi:aspartate/methionine/tyrosine aminotransferase/SAM-dependent methyltransferase
MAAYPVSRSEAVERIRALATRLSDPISRAEALVELRELADSARDREDDAPLRATVIDACIGTRQERLELLLLPSIFAPEDWAFTFLEGLFKVPLDEYAGKCLLELGTGSGWICVALAKFTELARIWGVDLNPHSAPLATCNGWLNGVDAGGRVRFATSDLLKGVPPELRCDFVIGCIPQVLRTEMPALDREDESMLYDLSNYCAIQNVYEDHFGLGLIARLLDEVPERLTTGGRVLLNLAGRPGRPIIERMFSRRGFRTQVMFARRVPQATDTDIGPLVQLEAQTGSAFEFFLDAHSAEPICAATAMGWLAGSRHIWHEVAVWEGRLRLPREVNRLREALRTLGMESVLAQMDLGEASSEQLEFVIALAHRLHAKPQIPYAHVAGDATLRADVARYLDRFFGLSLSPREIFVAPEREQAVYSLLLATCDPEDRILVSRNVSATFARALAKAGVAAVIGNDNLHEIGRLLEAFDVKLVLLAVEPDERSNLAELRAILELAARRGIWVVLDESAYFNITTGVEAHTLFEFLAREPVHPNLVILYGLIKNAVFPDFELTLMLPVPEPLGGALEVVAEVTYSRIATLPQLFYQQLFTDLLAVRVSFSSPLGPCARTEPAVPLPCSARIQRLAAFPALAPPCFDLSDPELIRLDYGENESAIPNVLIAGLMTACVARRGEAGQPPLADAVAAFLLETRGIRYDARSIVLAQGVWPLLHDLAHVLSRRVGRPARFAVFSPCYGMLPPALASTGAHVTLIPRERPLEQALSEPPDALVLCQPQNPLGIYLSREAVLEVATYVVSRRCWLISDEVFGLLNLSDPASETVPSPVTLESALSGLADRTLVLGGLSKETAAGGLRVGWLATRDMALASELRAVNLGPVHRTSGHAAAHLYSAFARTPHGKLQHPERHREMRAYFSDLRRDLARKRALLASVFPDASFEPRGTLGGLFIAPRINDWLGRAIDGAVLTPENFPRILYEHTHVVVNSGAWCGDTSRIRAVFSLPDDRLELAAERIRAFTSTWLDSEGKPRGEPDPT